ncbi:autotransporter outer membrane beta-barrel domain-containing protein [Taibaiella koreensis]|uniref:autotransporter outer membrane beta-barrel domain-containing protein n=1 Tax=Taibaiella koreensis TaxID=1268548 RepID=UPI000E59DE57|nr:autotransporter outer membrane beta-barrel domain-containing protein [Taibaiella koreensis]
MNKLIYLLAAISLPAATYAQNGFYLSASGGAGISNATRSEIPGPTLGDKHAVFQYGARITVGYQMKRWRLQTGVQYLTSGFKRDLIFGNDFNPANLPGVVNPSGDQSVTFHHIGIPVQVAYTLPLGNKLSLVPTLGVLATYNTGATVQTWEGNNKSTYNLTGDAFGTQYNRISVWGTAALHLEYKLSDKVSLFGGPSASYMFGNMVKQGSIPYASVTQRNYNIGFELGIKIAL